MKQAHKLEVDDLWNGLVQAQSEAAIWKDKYETLKAKVQGTLEDD